MDKVETSQYKLEIPCQTAVAIIAKMQGDGNRDLVRASLRRTFAKDAMPGTLLFSKSWARARGGSFKKSVIITQYCL
jgi:hypothetical protein